MTPPPRFISLFSGGGGADIGALLAGYVPVAANEYDPAIAEVYVKNIGNHVRVGDILAQDPRDYPPCDLLHASPPCPNFSVAKTGAEETPHDIALAEKVAEFIRVLTPRAVTIENVIAYRDSRSYKIILKAISDGGYMYDAEILNSADYGVPQTRRRFIVRAVKGLLCPMPEPMRWMGWYEAIEDLIPTLPDSRFADWQLARLPEEIKTVLINPPRTSFRWAQLTDAIDKSIPAPAITCGNQIKSFIMDANEMRGDGLQIDAGLPYGTVRAAGGLPRALIMPNENSTSAVTRNDTEPAPTVGSVDRVGNIPRAWLARGRVVKMTPRALARFQSFPDWYILPDKTALACRIIGNAVPPKMYQAIVGSLA